MPDVLDRALDGLGADELGAVSLPAPSAPLEALLALPVAPLVAWHGRDGLLLVGLGEAARCVDAASAERLYRRVRGPAPPCLGGLAFAPGSSGDDDIWRGFGDGRFVLPRWTYAASGGAATLTFCGGADGPDPTDELAAIWDRLLRSPRPSVSPAACAQDDGEPYRRLVAAALDEIHAGRLRKVVTARHIRVEADGPFSDAAIVARLAAPGATRFVLRIDGVGGAATFLGASPERLVARRGREVESEALAGSAPVGRAEALSASTKDRDEHRPVVEAIAAALAPLCTTLDVAAAPEPRALRDIVHLATPIRGRLAADTHILDVAAALHPTPAVGGTPRAAALAFIAAHEPSRGFYAAPFGWFDREGDGELAVALRSGVVRGREAHLYAGGGIVAGSDPEAELAETRLKLRTMLAALGAEA
jgi:isochorismate synthase